MGAVRFLHSIGRLWKYRALGKVASTSRSGPVNSFVPARVTSGLKSVCVRSLLSPVGAGSFPTCTHCLRRGLYSFAASRLETAGLVPPQICKGDLTPTLRPPPYLPTAARLGAAPFQNRSWHTALKSKESHFWQNRQEVGTRSARPVNDHRRKRLLRVEIVIGLADSGVKDYAACAIPQGGALERTSRSTSIFA